MYRVRTSMSGMEPGRRGTMKTGMVLESHMLIVEWNWDTIILYKKNEIGTQVCLESGMESGHKWNGSSNKVI